jgi:hypothetical protein
MFLQLALQISYIRYLVTRRAAHIPVTGHVLHLPQIIKTEPVGNHAKAKASLKNSELLQRFKEIDVLPEEEQGILLKVISAYIRDYKAKQAYAS